MMNKLLLSLFLASMALVAGAQDFADQKEKSENLVGEESRMSFQTDTTQSLFALSKETRYQEDEHLRTRLTYPTTLFSSSLASSSTSYTTSDGNMLSSPKLEYKPLRDVSWVGVPLFAAGIIAKGEKEAFRQDYKNSPANTRLVTSFKTHIDDYLQFFSPAMTLGLKAGGVEGRSDWQRMLVSAAMSYGLMAGFVNGIKYTASEMRPDGTTANSWPSGHTATAFVGATILHKEYGLTRSPWYSVVGYSAATATGIMRVLNNRHWVSDVLSGAGIGIVSGELAYLLSDLIYKDRHILRKTLSLRPDNYREHPSFFDVGMGIGFGSSTLDFNNPDSYLLNDYGVNPRLKFKMATAVQVEGAYFLNNFVGLGGRLRVRTTPMKGWGDFMKIATSDVEDTMEGLKEMDRGEGMEDIEDLIIEGKMADMIEDKEITIASDHLTEFAGDVGVYFNIPLNKNLALGTKALIGRSIMQSLDINAKFKGKMKGLDYDFNMRNGEIDNLVLLRYFDKDESYENEWDYLTVSGSNSTKYGTGISLSYSYHGNFSWKIFCDYDYTRKSFTMTYDSTHFMKDACSELYSLLNFILEGAYDNVYTIKKHMHQFVIGASLSIQF